MKTKCIIFLLSLFVISLPTQAAPKNANPQTAVVVQAEKSAKINLNTADIHTLTGSFKGIGAKRAEAIVEYRQMHKFENLEQLSEVKGLGKSFVARNLEQLKEVFTVE